MKDKLINDKGYSRREVIKGVGQAAAGAAILTTAGLGFKGLAYGEFDTDSCIETPKTTASGAKFPWPYKKLDPDKAASIAYENWYKGFCAYAVTSAILGQLQDVVGEPYSNVPIEAFSFGHGGTVGWGTLCGTLFGAGISASFAAGHTGEKITNDVLAWYSQSELPIFTPKKARANIKNVSSSGSPLCHVSVGKWMARENVKFFSPERKDRCARLAADVARQTVMLLNAAKDGTYKPAHGSQAKMHQITAQNNCTDCHGSDIPAVPGI